MLYTPSNIVGYVCVVYPEHMYGYIHLDRHICTHIPTYLTAYVLFMNETKHKNNARHDGKVINCAISIYGAFSRCLPLFYEWAGYT
jgi:hypothetical protein